jgi:hypothetical protein
MLRSCTMRIGGWAVGHGPFGSSYRLLTGRNRVGTATTAFLVVGCQGPRIVGMCVVFCVPRHWIFLDSSR